MTNQKMSFIVTKHIKETNRDVYVYITMTPTDTQPRPGDLGLDLRYTVRTKILSPLVYWFMTRVLKYGVA